MSDGGGRHERTRLGLDDGGWRRRLDEAGQGHVMAAFEDLEQDARQRLMRQVLDLDLELVRELGELARAGASEARVERFDPPPVFPLRRDARQEREAEAARRRGAELLRAGEVGFLLVAGGQGSRLGFEGPKGLFPVGPVSGCTLFEWHARRILAARRRHGAPLPLYVMTSAANDAQTRDWFARNGHAGLPERDVVFFQQAMLPALDGDGRILMAERDSMFLAPNGHGGSLTALAESGALDDARRRGIEVFSYFQVDNPLVRPADPLFLGLHAAAGARMSSKVVAKRDPAEKVGVLGLADGVLRCIEYSDLPAGLREERDGRGELRFRAGNIAVHLIERSFVEELTAGDLRLPWHVARKEMAVLDGDGSRTRRMGYKFETFVFDALALAGRSVTLEVERDQEFSPIKNASGVDSPETARAALTARFADWLVAAGIGGAPRDEGGRPWVEVDPRLAEDREAFLAAAPARPRGGAGGWLFS